MSTTQVPEIETKILTLRTSAEALVITNQRTYDGVSSFLSHVIVPLRKQIVETFAPIKAKTYAAWKEAVAQEKKHLDPVDVAERLLKGKIAVWEQEQERLRQVEQRRLEAEARRREEDERLESALAAECGGCPSEEIEAIIDTPSPPIAVVAPRTFQRAEGISTRENWTAEVVNKQALDQFVATHHEFGNLTVPNTTALNQLARAQKGLLNIPGVRAVRVAVVNVK